MFNKTNFIIALLSLFIGLSKNAQSQSSYDAYQATADPIINGIGSESCWTSATWKSIDQLWIGLAPSASDFQGKYKVCWRGSKLFLLVEVTDDVLYDGHTDPLVQWYNDDCVEIFIDEDRSKGNHQCTYNAFAYHVATNGDVVDLGNDCNPHLYNSHITSARTVSGNVYTWEIAMTIYGSSYSEINPNTPVSLFNGKTCGLSMAYCDDDGSNTRESFMGSEVMPAGHNNDNYITADYFGTLNLKDVALGLDDPEIYVSDGSLNVILNENKICQVSVFDLSGKCIYAAKSEMQRNEWDVNFSPGFYIVKIQTETNYYSRKIWVK